MFDPSIYTIPIFHADERFPDLEGSAVLLDVDGRKFAVTAAHVFEREFNLIGSGFTDNGKFRFVFDPLDPSPISANGTKNPVTGCVEYTNGIDIAVWEPRPGMLEQLSTGYQFFNFRNNTPSATPSWAIVVGWPARRNVFVSRKRLCDFQMAWKIECPFSLDQEDAVQKMGGETKFVGALDANKKKDFFRKGARYQIGVLKGMSGGGVWNYDYANHDQFPKVATSLAGIVVEDHDNHNLLKFVKADYIWEALHAGFGIKPHYRFWD